MAEHRYTGNNADLSSAAAWSSGVAPSAWATTDTVLFAAATTEPVAGLDQSAVEVARVTVTRECTLNIGRAENPLRFNITASAGNFQGLVHRGTGTLYFGGAGGSDIVVDSPNLTGAARLSHNVGSLFVKSGRVDVAGGATVSASGIMVVDGARASVYLPAGGSGQYPFSINVLHNGYVECGRITALANLKRIVVAGGVWRQTGVLAQGNEVMVLGPGVFEYVNAVESTADLNLYAVGGTVDARGGGINADTFIVGSSVDTFGHPGGGTITPTPSGIVIDLRKEYP